MISDPIHRAKHRQLWIDKVRDGLEDPALLDLSIKTHALNNLAGSTAAGLRELKALPKAQLKIELIKHDLADSLPNAALRTLKALGWPQRGLTMEDWPACQPIIGGALDWCIFDIVGNPQTRIMLLDDTTAKAVTDSDNDPITAAELQHLPHNPCLIEFYRPIGIAEAITTGVRLRAVGFKSLGDTAFPVAVVGFYFDCWEPMSRNGTRWPAMFGVWFGGATLGAMSRATRKQLGIVDSDTSIEEAFTANCERVARNLWDFITMRSIKYERIKRKPAKAPPIGERPQHVQGLHSQLDREVFHLYLSHEIKLTESEKSAGRPHPPQWGYRVEVPGKFHQLVYCGKCGDLHRHDLLGHACRKCGEVVGPRANVRVEKSWHHPYLMGPETAPLKEVVRDVHRKKRRQ